MHTYLYTGFYLKHQGSKINKPSEYLCADRPNIEKMTNFLKLRGSRPVLGDAIALLEVSRDTKFWHSLHLISPVPIHLLNIKTIVFTLVNQLKIIVINE